MKRAMISNTLVILAFVCLSGCGAKDKTAEDKASGEASQTPATVEQAARILDLSTFPLMEGAKPPGSRSVASLSYAATGDAKTGYEFHRKTLTAQGWKELPNSSVTVQSASGIFSRSGFVLSLSAYPDGSTGGLAVMMQNHGNIKPGQLPVPPGTKPVYVGDSSAMYVTEATVPATTEACRQLLLSQSWVPYGGAADSAHFKQNAILVTATVSAAPAHGGKTIISYSSQLISADIPAPPDIANLRYTDHNPELTFETAANQDAIVAFYRQALATTGWESTMDKTVEVDGRPMMIFRNPAKDMITLAFSPNRGGKLPVSVRFQSAAEIAELDRKMKEQAPAIRAALEAKEAKESARSAERNKPLPKVAVTLPVDAKVVEQTKDAIKFTVATGKAKAAAEALRTQFRDAGWQEDVASLDGVAGALSFSKEEGQSLTISYTDTGMMPSEISLSAMRAELELR